MKKTSLRRLLVAACPVSVAVVSCWFGIYTFVNAHLTKGLGYSNVEWTAATLWLTGGMIVWPFICMEIAARIGRRTTITLSIAVAALFYFGMAVTSHLAVIHLLLALVSVVVAVSTAVWLPLVAEIGREYPGRSLGLVQFVSAGVGAVFLVCGGFLVAALSYRTAFLIFGLLCALCAVVFHSVARRLESDELPAVVSMRHFSRRDLRALFSAPFLLVLLLGMCLEPYNYHTINQLFPNLARDHHAMRDGTIGLIIGLGRLPALLALLVIAGRIDRMNARGGYGLCMAMVGVCVATMGLVQGSWTLAGLYTLYYLFQGAVWGANTPAINAATNPRVRDSAFALLGVVSPVALFLTGVVHNRLIFAGVSLPLLFTICGAIAVVGGLILAVSSLRTPRATQRDAHPPEATPAA